MAARRYGRSRTRPFAAAISTREPSRRATSSSGPMPAMEEIVPGVLVWHAQHDGIGMTVHSAYVAPARALIDPMLPPGGVEAIAALGEPERA